MILRSGSWFSKSLTLKIHYKQKQRDSWWSKAEESATLSS